MDHLGRDVHEQTYKSQGPDTARELEAGRLHLLSSGYVREVLFTKQQIFQRILATLIHFAVEGGGSWRLSSCSAAIAELHARRIRTMIAVNQPSSPTPQILTIWSAPRRNSRTPIPMPFHWPPTTALMGAKAGVKRRRFSSSTQVMLTEQALPGPVILGLAFRTLRLPSTMLVTPT